MYCLMHNKMSSTITPSKMHYTIVKKETRTLTFAIFQKNVLQKLFHSYIGVGRFRILGGGGGGQGLEYWRGARWGQIPSRHMAS